MDEGLRSTNKTVEVETKVEGRSRRRTETLTYGAARLTDPTGVLLTQDTY